MRINNEIKKNENEKSIYRNVVTYYRKLIILDWISSLNLYSINFF